MLTNITVLIHVRCCFWYYVWRWEVIFYILKAFFFFLHILLQLNICLKKYFREKETLGLWLPSSQVMSSDYPPGYDDPNKPLYPQGGSYPAPPPYGFPSYGGPQPNAPYPPGPNTHMYPGPGGYPPAYPGQPHAGGPPPMPPIMPPTIPVYMILAAQLTVTTAIVAVFTFVDSVKTFVQENQALYWASYAVYFITHLVLVCCTGPRPYNLLKWFEFSSNTLLFTKVEIFDIHQTCRGLFCVLGIVMFVTGIITVIVLSFKYIYWLHMLYAALGAIVFTMFLAYHTQLLIGNRKYSIGPDEYIFAALSIYVDVIQIFLFLLQIIGSSNR
uniref:Uncharacterized protein n=1 Tax=Periophthalmus magnuspinnatus TaxID=409849 RepID=A0A3B4B9C2_9GOBI